MVVLKENKKGNFGYWIGKTPCWEIIHCPDSIRNYCPVYLNPDIPGWRVGGAYCPLFDSREIYGDFKEVCRHCRVYQEMGDKSLN